MQLEASVVAVRDAAAAGRFGLLRPLLKRNQAQVVTLISYISNSRSVAEGSILVSNLFLFSLFVVFTESCCFLSFIHILDILSATKPPLLVSPLISWPVLSVQTCSLAVFGLPAVQVSVHRQSVQLVDLWSCVGFKVPIVNCILQSL